MSTLYGVGVGCGDPADLTVRAANLISGCDVVAFPAGTRDNCRAYDIVKEYIKKQKTEFFDFPMTHDAVTLEDRHRRIYEKIKEHLDDGKSVAFVTIGDPLIYSTFSYIAELARKYGYPVQIVNGIPSFLSCAGKLGLFLGQENEEIHIIPGSADIREALGLPGIKIFMKLGKHAAELRKVLEESGHKFLGAVSHCGMPDEEIYTDIDSIPEKKAYLMTAFVR